MGRPLQFVLWKENEMFDVACVGILVADVLAKPVDDIPEKGLLSLVDSIEIFTGGNAMTASLNLKKMGLNSAIIGRIGKDSFGEFLKNKLIAQGVNTDSLAEDCNVQTSASVALSSSDGERTFLHCVGANKTFSINDVNWDIIKQSKIVFVTGTFLLDTFDGSQTAVFLKKCKELGKITALDVCWDSKNNWNRLLVNAYPYIDIFLPSIQEAEKLSDIYEDLDKTANFFLESGVSKVVIKLGAEGALLKESIEEDYIIIPSCKNIKVVDTTGAGDSFCSGFLAALAKGNSIKNCVSFANVAGAYCVMKRGATTGIKSYDEMYKFMEEKV